MLGATTEGVPMTGLIVFVAGIAAVLGSMLFAWSRRGRILRRGVGAAGAEYNRLHGFSEVDTGSAPSARVTIGDPAPAIRQHPAG